MEHSDFELIWEGVPGDCPYIAGEQARMPFRQQLQPIPGERLDELLRQGYRRHGTGFYRPECPACQACESLRLEVDRFQPSRAQRRVWRRGQREFTTRVAAPSVDQQRLRLVNRHRLLRGLGSPEDGFSGQSYRDFLVHSCCQTREISYWQGARLSAVAILDVGVQAASAVYTFFDPDASRLSPGTYSILTQVELCRRWGIRYLYLGFYNAQSSPLVYKRNFQPHQRRISGAWRDFDNAAADEPTASGGG